MLTEALLGVEELSGTKRGLEQGPFYTSFPKTIVPPRGRLNHCVGTERSPRDEEKQTE